MLKISGERFVNSDDGLYVNLRGINLCGDMKSPVDGSYTNSFPLDEADEHLLRIKSLGFNTLRLLFTWDALEPNGPGQYDNDYIEYMVKLVTKCAEHGFYVIMDPHQDIWSRFSFGSGAPLWTFYVLGLNPDNFEATLAAMDGTKHTDIDMLWASNYHRLACQTMFTAFYAGKTFFPKCIINGVNVQTYLQTCFQNAVAALATAINNYNPKTIIGWESMNEPGHGLIGYQDLDSLPNAHHHVKLGPSPTPYQAMLLGVGQTQTVDIYRFTSFGVKKTSSTVIDPKGQQAWLDQQALDLIDKSYNWTRSWTAGCVFQLHKIYKKTDKRYALVKPDYFALDENGRHLASNDFVNVFFLNHYLSYRDDCIYKVNSKDWLMFMQPPVNCTPPNLKDIANKHNAAVIDDKTVYAPHYYDGMTLMMRQWRPINVDALGVLRNRYANPPIMALRLGHSAIRQCLKSQLRYLKKEANSYFDRRIPLVITEIGVPFNMSPSSYNHAVDSHSHALEQANIHHTWWVYTRSSTQKNGDNWNGEDFSIFCNDFDNSASTNSTLYKGVRVMEALARPHPTSTNGELIDYSFDMKQALFTASFKFAGPQFTKAASSSPTSAKATDPINQSKEPIVTIFLPEFYYPSSSVSNSDVVVTSGTWKINVESDKVSQYLVWKPEPSGDSLTGIESISIKTVPKYSAGQACTIS